MSFTGFPVEALDFYEGLEADNSRTYWQAHRDGYERHVRAPMEALLTELAAEFGAAKIFRPNRDVRFSPDKSPYKTHCGAVVRAGDGMAAGYVQISADGLLVAGGYYATASDQVDRYRRAVTDDVQGAALERIVATLRDGDYRVEGYRLKSAPRGYPRDHPRIELLRHRTLNAARSWPPEPWLATPRPVGEVRTAWHAFVPLLEWLTRNVGPSTRGT
ncbi:MAG: DUF2461 domain-containing protein [Actinobacteria bacterium]|nr:DUF2461 domain-containing protein [Actinomycetota bacterium]MBI3688049.1 DUF2461 domain-containing protein [Actinomycetota bacterium]